MTIDKGRAREKAYENAAALIETLDIEQLYGDFWLEHLDDDTLSEKAAHLLESAQQEVVAYLRTRANLVAVVEFAQRAAVLSDEGARL
jgi:hypothetical protein